MTKCERVEDLGRIDILLRNILIEFDDEYGSLLTSKHAFENFEKHLHSDGKLYDLHMFLRWHIEKLENIHNIAHGDMED